MKNPSELVAKFTQNVSPQKPSPTQRAEGFHRPFLEVSRAGGPQPPGAVELDLDEEAIVDLYNVRPPSDGD